MRSFRDRVVSASRQGSPTQLGFYDRKSGSFETTSLRSLLDEVSGAAAALRESSRPGTPVLVVARSPETILRGYFAAILANRPPAIYPARLASESDEQARKRLARLSATLGPHIALAERSRMDALAEPHQKIIAIDDDHGSLRAEDLIAAEHPQRNDIAHYQFSSGSTRQPTAIAISNENLLFHLQALIDRIELEEGDTLVSWLPLGHDMGLVSKALLSAFASVDLRLMSPFDFISRPAAWLKAIAQYPAVMTASPSMSFEVVTHRIDDSALEGLDLSGWKRAYCGAEPVHIPTLERFLARFEPYGFDPSALKPTYGLAEATLMATMPSADSAGRYLEVDTTRFSSGERVSVRSEHTLGSGSSHPIGTILQACLGHPARGTDVSLRDDDDVAILEDQVVGNVVVDGPAISPGIRTEDGEVRRAAGPHRTGDLGYFYDGELVIVDRVKSIIIWNGENFSASASEHVLSSAASIPASKTAVIDLEKADGRTIVAVMECLRGQDPEEAANAMARARSAVPHPVHEIRVLPPGSMPRTTSGKLQRHKLRAELTAGRIAPLFEVGELPEANGPKPEPVRTRNGHDRELVLDLDLEDARSIVYALIRDSLESRGRSVPALSDDLNVRDDLALDSVDLLEICLGVEDEFHITVDEEALAHIRSVGDIVDLRDYRSDRPSIHALLSGFQEQVPQIWRTVSSQRNRMLTIDGHELVDLASLNYLGLDLLPEVARAVPGMIDDWGVHPSWTRAVASPEPYVRLEAELARLTGAPDTLVFPTITLLHFGVLPLLVGHGTLIIDVGAHHSIQEASDLIRARGGAVRPFKYDDLETLEESLRRSKPGPRVIALNGVYSMTGAIPPLGEIAAIAGRYDAQVYVDDAHGIGVLGADPSPDAPYGHGGGGVIRHLGLDPDRFIYVGGMSKAFSSMAAFISVRNSAEKALYQRASTVVFSGPIPVASLASAIAGLEVNARCGDVLRAHLLEATRDLIRSVRRAGLPRDGTGYFPIVNVPIGSVDRTIAATKLLWDEGVLLTPSVFPAAPLNRGGLRMSLTSSHTEQELAIATAAMERLAEAIPPIDLGSAPRRVEI